MDERAIHFGGADPHPMPVQRGIGASEDETAAAAVHFEEVPVTPYAGVVVEVGSPITAAVGIVPKPDRHRRQGLRDDELADFVDHGGALGIEYIGGHAELARLNLARVDRQSDDAADDAGTEVGAAAAREGPEFGPHAPVDPGHAFGGARGSRQHDRS